MTKNSDTETRKMKSHRAQPGRQGVWVCVSLSVWQYSSEKPPQAPVTFTYAEANTIERTKAQMR